jgi:hypothetical protein
MLTILRCPSIRVPPKCNQSGNGQEDRSDISHKAGASSHFLVEQAQVPAVAALQQDHPALWRHCAARRALSPGSGAVQIW